nr:hypothetical protein [bacterium]
MKRKKKPRTKRKPQPPAELKKAAEAVLRYRSQPDMKSRRFINPTT